jgi:hypothetical protein
MAHIDWIHLCELAYFDRQGRLCIVGMTTHFVLPALPIRLRQIMLVARVAEARPGVRLDVGFGLATPAGIWMSPNSDDDVHVEVAGDYILVTLRDVPFQEEGGHRFGIQLGPQQLTTVDVPVVIMPAAQPAEYH